VHAVFPAKLGHRHAAFGLAQDRKDLGFAISRHLHLNLLVYLAEKILLPQPLTFGGDYRLIGQTKGGMNTKLHAVTDTNGRPIRFFITAGQVSDYTGQRLY
jgi:hypothetical protein